RVLFRSAPTHAGPGCNWDGRQGSVLSTHAPLDTGHDVFSRLDAPMGQQPARALGHVPPYQSNGNGQHGTQNKTQPPPPLHRYKRLVQNQQTEPRTQRRAEPEASIDGQADAASYARRHEFVDGGINGRVLAPYAQASCKAAQQEEPRFG